MKSKLFLCAMLLLGSTNVLARGYQGEIDRFFRLYEKGKKSEAVDAIYSTNTWMSSASDSIQKMKVQFKEIEKLVGQYNGSVLIDETRVKDRFVHVTYLALYDRQPVRMEFQFYRPKDRWIIYSYSFDVDFDDEIQRGARTKIARGG